MKRSPFQLALVAMAVMAIQHANAGSAVAYAHGGHTVYSFGHPKAIEIRRVLESARLYGWTDARIIAASDATGYCAIAVAAHKGGGVVVGVALGKRSATEADTLAIQHCLKAGGTNPRVRWGWYG
jgi:hypothetical protein